MQEFDPNPPRLRPGMVVCMTGGHPALTRYSLVAFTEEHDVVWKQNMSAQVDVLVAADPASQTGKARKARELGRPIVSYEWLLGGLNELELRSKGFVNHETRTPQLLAEASSFEPQRT